MEIESLIALFIVCGILFFVLAQQFGFYGKIMKLVDDIKTYIERINPNLAITIVLVVIAVVLAFIAGISV